jgi:hypothetical protein
LGPSLATCLKLPPPAMNELIVSDVLQDLDQRHEHLLVELDDLNERLEQTLNSLNKPSEAAEPAAE